MLNKRHNEKGQVTLAGVCATRLMVSSLLPYLNFKHVVGGR